MSATKAKRDPSRVFSRTFDWAGHALGFSIGGFFDGIILHQILQWHHLLSGIEEAQQDIRVLVLWDGIFHGLMYIIAGVGLWLLWRARKEFPASGADRRLCANSLIAFGTWHILDGILSHWILGIHRIRMDVNNPLFWDLLWFVLFGALPFICGWAVRRTRTSGRSSMLSSPLALVMATALSGPLAALPPQDQQQVIVLFKPGITVTQAVAAIEAVDANIIGSDVSGQLWIIEGTKGLEAFRLYRHGALLVTNSVLPLGCISWTSIQSS
ncbi:DUF2243 domain-containing protein [Pararhizobium arenae]|uniref:DUF2243 domain-containing protein n=1 Tax=Pararhizobium arenae TaxID=1856850 RepID=UPI00094B0402|nr:DUF2243 domain-containing protein [Pararhizobium arenae]